MNWDENEINEYYAGSWGWLEFDPKKSNVKEFKATAMRQLGALNVIDNTKRILIGAENSGDLIMPKWSSTSGYTRIIYSVTLNRKNINTFDVVWYQGNLPIVIPQRKTSIFSNISGVYQDQPRRWNFEQFNK